MKLFFFFFFFKVYAGPGNLPFSPPRPSSDLPIQRGCCPAERLRKKTATLATATGLSSWTWSLPWTRQVASQADCLALGDRKSTRLNSSHLVISYAVFCL